MSFAAIFVPDFPLAAVLRAEPELRSQAVAVVEGTPPLVRVIAANDRAGEAGVETGMTKLQAEECLSAAFEAGNWCLRQRSPEQEAAAHAALLDCAGAFSPRVEETTADTVLLDLAGLERIFGPPAKMAHELARRCHNAGLAANVAIASNPDAAMHAARGFSGVTVIAPGQEAEVLGSLPVDVLLWGTDSHEILETLDRWGVRALRALAALPEVAVTERLGQEGLRWQRLARGAGSRPLVAAEPPLKFEETMELEYPVALLEPLSFLLSRMLEQLCSRLAAHALATHELRLRLSLDQSAVEDTDSPPRHRDTEKNLKLESCNLQSEQTTESADNHKLPITNYQSSASRCLGGETTHERTLRFPVPMLDAKVFLRLLQLDLKAHPPGAPVVKIRLEAEPAQPRVAQNGLFLPVAPEPEKLEVVLARIAGVVNKSCGGGSSTRPARAEGSGTDLRVGTPALLDTHRPDAFQVRRFVSESPVASRQSPENERVENAAITALRVFRPPLRAVVEVRDQQPAHVGCAARPALRGDVIWAAGPWRESGGWWEDSRQSPVASRQSPWDREEWDVAIHNEAGVAFYRLVRDVAGGAWWLEGTYD